EQVAAFKSGGGGDAAAAVVQVTALTEEKDRAVAAHQALAEELQATKRQLGEAREQLQQQQQQLPSTTTTTKTDAAAAANATETDEQLALLRARLADAEAKVKGYEEQLEHLKARALKYARDNKVLQARGRELENQLAELKQGGGESLEPLQAQLDEAKRQLAEAEAKIEVATVNAKKSAELRAQLQISRANKRAEELEKQVAVLEEKAAKAGAADSGDATAAAAEVTLKRPSDADDGPAKKPHIDSSEN
ncbi:hypothetical protein IWW38_005389, partial [Coemansia aciculifera]